MKLTPTSKILRDFLDALGRSHRSDPESIRADAIATQTALIQLLETLTAQQELQDHARGMATLT